MASDIYGFCIRFNFLLGVDSKVKVDIKKHRITKKYPKKYSILQNIVSKMIAAKIYKLMR